MRPFRRLPKTARRDFRKMKTRFGSVVFNGMEKKQKQTVLYVFNVTIQAAIDGVIALSKTRFYLSSPSFEKS